MTITEFLLARIAEDEAVACGATPGPWEWSGTGDEDWLSAAGDDASVISASGMHTEGYLYVSIADKAHIARYDPARVLAECAAKRAIVADQSDVKALAGRRSYDSMYRVAAGLLERQILHLAAVYADHPDYLPEWAL